MTQTGLYGFFRETMQQIMNRMTGQIEEYGRAYEAAHGEKLYEHLICRIKSEESAREKLCRLGQPADTWHALRSITDTIGIRIVCLFIDDVYENVRQIKSISGCSVVREKDYIHNAKPNGYRSYHMILDVETDEPDVDGNTPGHYYVEIQLRTIAMDTWAALEHELHYKQDTAENRIIAAELKRVADELASCDLSMQTLRTLIRGKEGTRENSSG